MVSVTDLRQDATNILNMVSTSQEPVYVVQNSELRAVILDPGDYQAMQETIEDFLDGIDSQAALNGSGGVSINEYIKKRWGKSHGSNSPIKRKKRTGPTA